MAVTPFLAVGELTLDDIDSIFDGEAKQTLAFKIGASYTFLYVPLISKANFNNFKYIN